MSPFLLLIFLDLARSAREADGPASTITFLENCIMGRFTAVVCVFLLCLGGPAFSQEKKADRIAELEAEISKLEARLVQLKAELAKLKPKTKNVWKGTISPALFTVGEEGRLIHSSCKINNVVNENEMIVTITDVMRGGPYPFMVRQPTKGLAEGRLLKLDGVYEVLETKKVGARTYYVVQEVP